VFHFLDAADLVGGRRAGKGIRYNNTAPKSIHLI
jgi:hypothetical protein